MASPQIWRRKSIAVKNRLTNNKKRQPFSEKKLPLLSFESFFAFNEGYRINPFAVLFDAKMQMALLRALNVGRFADRADHIAKLDALAGRHTNIIA